MRRCAQARSGRLTQWAIVGLFFVFVGLTAYQLYARRVRFRPDPALAAELAGATVLDEAPALPPKDRPWPQWLGPTRDGVTSYPQLRTAWPGGGHKKVLKWEAPGGDGYSSFVVGDGRVFTQFAVAGGEEAVVCFDAETGQEKWRHTHRPARSYQFPGPLATPALDGERLYAVGSAGLLLCLEANSGKVVWQTDLRAEFKADEPRWGYAASPLIEGERVIVVASGNDGRSLAAFDKKTGAVAWAALPDVGSYASPIAVTAGGVRQIVYFAGKRLVGVTLDGQFLWEFPWRTEHAVNAATPLHFRAKAGAEVFDYLFISSGYGKGCAVLKVVPDGKGKCTAKGVYESNELCCHFSTPVRKGPYVYGLDETRDLTCMDLRTGEVLWRQGGFQKGSLLRVDDRLIVLGEGGKLALVEADPEEYTEVATYRPFRNRCWTLPVLADGLLYLRDQNKVMCLDLRPRGK